MLNCYIINLDRATERWKNVVQSPGSGTGTLSVYRRGIVPTETLIDSIETGTQNVPFVFPLK